MTERPSEDERTADAPERQPPAGPYAGWQGEEDEISLLQLFSVLLKRRWTIIKATAAVAFLALILALMSARSFTSSTSFIPQGSESGMSGLAGIAGQFGFQLPTRSPGESPQFYAELVTSREILGSMAEETYEFQAVAGEDTVTMSGTLPELLELGDPAESTWPERREMAIRWLGGSAISTTTGRETGIVEVSVTTPWAGLSKRLADRLLQLLNEFNLQTRQSRAAAERTFVEARLEEMQDSLRAAEDRLEAWLERNRQWQGSAELSFEHERLQREVVMRQQVYTTLAEAHEQARIAEVRNTPVITIVESPELPVRADGSRRVLKLALGIVLGGMLGVFLAFGQEYMARARSEEEEEYQEFSSLWSQTWRDFRTLGGLLGRRKG